MSTRAWSKNSLLRRRHWCVSIVALWACIGVCSAAQAADELRYDWKLGQDYLYRINVGESGRTKVQQQGTARFRADAVPARSETPTNRVTQGTGLVVNRNGYLLTCAHVVRDAARIEITLGGRKYEATVVALDKLHDLALLHANTTDWPALRLADSDRLEQGQEVRVVGFPLSNVLGSGIKITRGILSAVIVEAGEKLLMVDATVNHGNSGGPLVNEQGDVVGVVSSNLNPLVGSNVGFARPINEARKLLTAQKISFEAAGDDATLSGPELAKRVIPSVAYVLVTPRPADSNWRKLVYRVDMGPKAQTGSTVVDSTGAIHDEAGSGLSMNLLGTIGFEQLAHEGERRWQTERAMTFAQKNVAPPPAPGQPQRQRTTPATVTIPGVEHARYEILSQVSGIVTIKKTTTVTTAPAARGKPPWLSAEGQGIFEFDSVAGVIRSSTFSVKVVGGNPPETSTRTLTYQQVEGKTLANLPTMPSPRTNASTSRPGPNASPTQPPAANGGSEGLDNRSEFLESIVAAIRIGGLPRTREIGPTTDSDEFAIVPAQGALLIGFDVSADDAKINALRPIFLTAAGRATGRWCGLAKAKPQRILAKHGYAVGAIHVASGIGLTGLSAQFMEIGSQGLNPAVSYQSNWLGQAPTADSAVQASGEGSAVIGIHGHSSATEISSLGLVLAPKK